MRLLSGPYFPYWNINFFSLPTVRSDTNETEGEKKRKSEGLKVRDGERDCRAIFGLSFPTHIRSRFSGLLLFKMVGVKTVSSDLTVLSVCACVCALLISLGFSCGCSGFFVF